MAFSYFKILSAAASVSVPPVPAGLIILYDDSTVPTGWSLFSSIDGKHVRSTSSGLSLTGGAATNDVAKLIGQTASGGHKHSGGSATNYVENNLGTAASYIFHRDANAGGPTHSHSVYKRKTFIPARTAIRFIKADADHDQLPQNGVLMGRNTASLSGLSKNVSISDSLLMGAGGSESAGYTGETDTWGTHYLGSSSSGTHYHELVGETDSGTSPRHLPPSGVESSHTHSISTVTVNQNTGSIDAVNKAYVSIWTALTAADVPTDGLAFWEGSTAPAGWYICDGTNGTEDLRGYFIMASSSNDTTKTGSSNSSATTMNITVNSWSTGNTGSSSVSAHTHVPSSVLYNISSSINNTNTYAGGSVDTHLHGSGSGLNVSVSLNLPTWYSLKIIKYVGA